MRFVDEFRDPGLAARLIERIRQLATRRWTVMEVCGGQTHSLLRHGIDAELADVIELIHGPGCPVCVTPAEAIDEAIALSLVSGITLSSFGDMLRVPGSRGSLLSARAAGGDVRAVYSPLEAVDFAQAHPERQVVFFAVGFETTAPATALAVQQAKRLELPNFSLLTSHVRVLPAMESLARQSDFRVSAFLAAGHVCAVLGFAEYEPFVDRFRLPVVVSGFEPTDLLEGLFEAVSQLERGAAQVANAYGRGVRREGNSAAKSVIDAVYESVDCPWRGLGIIAGGGLRLREEWRGFDARARGMTNTRIASTSVDSDPVADGSRGADGSRDADGSATPASLSDCPAGEVLIGRMKPSACPHFGGRCTPDSPLGAPMVSAEGACAAYFRYGHQRVSS
ncbi:MAG: Hydrogenase isoenzyme formation protein HypD [Planctomycetota bacterium]